MFIRAKTIHNSYTMALRLVFVLLFVFGRCQKAAKEFEDEVDQLSAQLLYIEQKLDELDKDENEKKMLELREGVYKIKGSSCDDFWEFQCGGHFPECIAHYLVCDGDSDCKNGADEKNCIDTSEVFPPGVSWYWYVRHDSCSEYPGADWIAHMDNYTDVEHFPSIPELHWNFYGVYTGDVRNAVVVPSLKSYYSHAKRYVFYRFMQTNHYMYYCYFDGVHWDRCTAFTFRQGESTNCAEHFVIRQDADIRDESYTWPTSESKGATHRTLKE